MVELTPRSEPRLRSGDGFYSDLNPVRLLSESGDKVRPRPSRTNRAFIYAATARRGAERARSQGPTRLHNKQKRKMQCIHSGAGKTSMLPKFLLHHSSRWGGSKYITAHHAAGLVLQQMGVMEIIVCRLIPYRVHFFFFFVRASCDFIVLGPSGNRTTGPDVPSLAT